MAALRGAAWLRCLARLLGAISLAATGSGATEGSGLLCSPRVETLCASCVPRQGAGVSGSEQWCLRRAGLVASVALCAWSS